MTVATLQFGQCGNQIGHEFFSTIWRDIEAAKPGISGRDNEQYTQTIMDQWFMQNSGKEKWYARTVLVDTENKVVDELQLKQSKNGAWDYDSKSCAMGSGGAGNNWALGFQRKGPELLENVSELLRIQVEKADRLTGIVSILSSAGGTGSGVGSFIIENIHDEYPTKSFVNTVILPFENGEVVTQSYNTLLTLAKIYNVADATLLIYNDHIQKMLSTLLHLSSVSINDLNSMIAQKMVGLYQRAHSQIRHSWRLSDTLCHLAPHPAFKFFTVKSSPHVPKENIKYEGALQWSVLAKHIKQTLRTNAINPNAAVMDWELKLPSSVPPPKHSLQQFIPSVANLVVTRGPAPPEAGSSVHSEFQEPNLYPKWIPNCAGFAHIHQNRRFNDLDKFIILATNNSQIHVPLDVLVGKAWKMFTHKAYLHQYTKFGILEEDFVEAFVKTESIIKAYKELKS